MRLLGRSSPRSSAGKDYLPQALDDLRLTKILTLGPPWTREQPL